MDTKGKLVAGSHIKNEFLIINADEIGRVTAVPPQPMDPKKYLVVYGYGTIAWKDRMDESKKKQNNRLQVVKCEGDNGGDNDEDMYGLGLPKSRNDGVQDMHGLLISFPGVMT